MPLLVGCVGLLVCVGAIRQCWWHLIEQQEPHFVVGFRIACVAALIVGIVGLFVPRHRPALWLTSAWMLTAVACGFLFDIVALRPGLVSHATFQYEQVTRLDVISLESNYDAQPLWSQILSEARLSQTVPVAKNSVTFADSAEITMFFAQGGWYLCSVAGILLWVAAYGEDVLGARKAMRRLIGPGMLCIASPWAIWLVAQLVSYQYYQFAQTNLANGHYRQALHDYKESERWDPRLTYDITYHYELGRLYGELHRTDEADYWAMLADSLLQRSDVQDAMLMYRTGEKLPTTPLFRQRFLAALGRGAFADLSQDRYGSCIQKAREALSVQPEDPEMVYALAICTTFRGDYRNAIPYWKRLIDETDNIGLFRNQFVSSEPYIKPIASRSWGAIAYCYFRLGEYDDANRCVVASRLLYKVPTDWMGQ